MINRCVESTGSVWLLIIDESEMMMISSIVSIIYPQTKKKVKEGVYLLYVWRTWERKKRYGLRLRLELSDEMREMTSYVWLLTVIVLSNLYWITFCYNSMQLLKFNAAYLFVYTTVWKHNSIYKVKLIREIMISTKQMGLQK